MGNRGERRAFSEAKDAILGAHQTRVSLCSPFVSAFPITGASVSVLAGPASQSTMCSSDTVASRVDELQFDLGEGPCWSALSLHRPIMSNDVRRDGEWPAFSEALRNDPVTSEVGALFAFPLTIGSLDIGAIDLYSDAASELAPEQVAEAATLAGFTAWQVLRRILEDHAEPYDASSLGFARREIHQATGMVIVQLEIPAADAELLLRAHAFSQGRTVREIANDIVERRLDFSQTERHDGAE